MQNERVRHIEMMGLILPTSYASALCLMLGATHLISLCATLVEQSSQACLQAGLADSLCVDYLAQVTPAGFNDRPRCSWYRRGEQIISRQLRCHLKRVAHLGEAAQNYHLKSKSIKNGHIILGFPK